MSEEINEIIINCIKYIPANQEQGIVNYLSPLINQYVLVRCRDAGVHAGILYSTRDRQCVLRDSRRLWYWKPKKGCFLSAVAEFGLHSDSKVSTTMSNLIQLTENCEIIGCSNIASKSIREIKDYESN